MKSLHGLKRLLKKLTNKSDLTEGNFDSQSNIPFARFATQSSHYRKSDLEVRQSLFLPPKNLELSVFRSDGLTQDDIKNLGNKHIPNIKGFTEVLKNDIEAIEPLKIQIDNVPPRHANIIGWPAQKSEQKLLALKLKEKATPLVEI